MRLNQDCIRDALLQLEQLCSVEEENNIYRWNPVSISSLHDVLPTYSKEDIYYSLLNLYQAGFIKIAHPEDDDSLSYFFVCYITYAGHNYLDSIRENQNWTTVKRICAKIGYFSLEMIAKVAEGVAIAYLKQHWELN